MNQCEQPQNDMLLINLLKEVVGLTSYLNCQIDSPTWCSHSSGQYIMGWEKTWPTCDTEIEQKIVGQQYLNIGRYLYYKGIFFLSLN